MVCRVVWWAAAVSAVCATPCFLFGASWTLACARRLRHPLICCRLLCWIGLLACPRVLCPCAVQKALEVQAAFGGAVELVAPHRMLVRQGELVKVGRRRDQSFMFY